MSSREQDDAGPTLLGISITILILVLTTTALRIAVRAKRSNLGADDYTIAAASLLTIGRVTCQFISVGYGNGRHREFLSVHAYQRINFLTWLTQLFLFPILCLLKISVCLLVLRVKSTKALRYGLWSLMVLLVLSTLLPEIVLLAECDPVSAYWMSHADRCWDPNVRIYSIYLQTAVSVFADVVCTLLPIAVVWHLTLSLKNKIAVCGLMSLGVVSTIFACVRASSLGLSVSDLSWAYCWAAIWGNIELGFGILGANLALSRTYYDSFKRTLTTLTNHTASHNTKSRTRASASHNSHARKNNNNNTNNSNSNSSSSAKKSFASYALSSLSLPRKSKSGTQHLSSIDSASGIAPPGAWDGTTTGGGGGSASDLPRHQRQQPLVYHEPRDASANASGGRRGRGDAGFGGEEDGDEVLLGRGIKREVEVSIQRDEDEDDERGAAVRAPDGLEEDGSASERSWEVDLEAGAQQQEFDGMESGSRARGAGRGF